MVLKPQMLARARDPNPNGNLPRRGYVSSDPICPVLRNRAYRIGRPGLGQPILPPGPSRASSGAYWCRAASTCRVRRMPGVNWRPLPHLNRLGGSRRFSGLGSSLPGGQMVARRPMLRRVWIRVGLTLCCPNHRQPCVGPRCLQTATHLWTTRTRGEA